MCEGRIANLEIHVNVLESTTKSLMEWVCRHEKALSAIDDFENRLEAHIGQAFSESPIVLDESPGFVDLDFGGDPKSRLLTIDDRTRLLVPLTLEFEDRSRRKRQPSIEVLTTQQDGTEKWSIPANTEATHEALYALARYIAKVERAKS